MLAEIWFFVLGIFLIMYVILDGFDLGGATILPFISDKESDKKIILNAIGRVWDGNEVWLIAFGAFLFGVFPPVYAKFFSGAYIPVMLLAFVLIFRAVSFEFRSKVESETWKKIFDYLLAFSSLLIIVVLSAAGANVLKGLPIGPEGFRLSLIEALNPFAILTALTVISLLILHSLLYLANKTEGELLNKIISWSKFFWILTLILVVIWGIVIAISGFGIYSNFIKYPILFIEPILTTVFLILALVYLNKENFKLSFLFSSLTVGGSILFFGLSMFPNLLKSSLSENYNLTLYNSASGELTLTIALVVALIGIVLVSIYNIYVYKTFAGKIKEEDLHY